MSAPIWYDSTETGAPVLNNAAGSLISLLRAVLINGFNVKAITGITVAAGVATVTCPAHGYSSAYGKWLQITGANAPLLNGVKQQTIVDANTFTFPAPGVANGSYTATDARRAPLGWAEEFVNGGNTIAIYRRTAPEATPQKLRVNDSGASGATATDARMLMVETATGVDTYTGPAPTDAQVSGGLYLHKGANTTAAKAWTLVGDDRSVYLFTQYGASAVLLAGHGLADIVPYYPADVYSTLVIGAPSAGSGSTSNSRFGLMDNYGVLASNFSFTAARAQSGAGSAQPQSFAGPRASNAVIGGPGLQTAGTTVVVSPSPLHVNDGAAPGIVRGEVPGVALLLFQTPFSHLVPVTITAADGDHVFLPINFSATGSLGQMLFDLGRDWYA